MKTHNRIARRMTGRQLIARRNAKLLALLSILAGIGAALLCPIAHQAGFASSALYPAFEPIALGAVALASACPIAAVLAFITWGESI